MYKELSEFYQRDIQNLKRFIPNKCEVFPVLTGYARNVAIDYKSFNGTLDDFDDIIDEIFCHPKYKIYWYMIEKRKCKRGWTICQYDDCPHKQKGCRSTWAYVLNMSSLDCIEYVSKNDHDIPVLLVCNACFKNTAMECDYVVKELTRLILKYWGTFVRKGMKSVVRIPSRKRKLAYHENFSNNIKKKTKETYLTAANTGKNLNEYYDKKKEREKYINFIKKDYDHDSGHKNVSSMEQDDEDDYADSVSIADDFDSDNDRKIHAISDTEDAYDSDESDSDNDRKIHAISDTEDAYDSDETDSDNDRKIHAISDTEDAYDSE